MRKLKQQFRHKPDEGIYGDCHRTAIAVILGCDPLDLPHKHQDMPAEKFHAMYDRWLRKRGIWRISVPFMVDTVEEAFLTPTRWNPTLPYILGGTSRTGVNHSVVGFLGKLYCDPSLTDSGIIGPTDNGYYFCDWLVRPAEGRAPDRAPVGVDRPAGAPSAREAAQ